MINKIITLFFLLLFGTMAIGQNETNNWCFGDQAGLNFNNNSLRVLTNSAMATPAGCATISDSNGQLRFYTNGQSVWNLNHELMDNGTDLAGEISNTQTSIIIPKPNDPDTYYIFVTRKNKTTTSPVVPSGLFYSEVQFSDQHPLGTVVVKNVRIALSVTERLTAIHHSESNTIRVIAFGNLSGLPNAPDEYFIIFNVTENGVTSSPITSAQQKTISAAGAMKMSPNGRFLAITDYGSGYIYLYDFDNDNVTLGLNTVINSSVSFGTYLPYGLEFSQDSKVLYFTVNDPYNTSFLRKYSLENPSGFNQSLTIASSRRYKFGSLQLASNGNIYVASYEQDNPLTSLNQIGVITEAENLEIDSGFQPLAIGLNSGQSYKGLPNFIPSYFRNRIITENTCADTPFEFSLDAYAPIESVLWDFGDGNSSTLLEPTHQYHTGGNYLVKATITINQAQVELYKNVEAYALPSINANERLIQCDLDNDGVAFFNLNTIVEKINNPNPDYELFFYETLFDLENDLAIENPEIYESGDQELFVKIISPEGCETISNFFLETVHIELRNISAMYACEDSDGFPDNGEATFDLDTKGNEIRSQFNIDSTSLLTFYATFLDAETKTDPLQGQHNAETTTIWVRIDNPNSGCNGIDSIALFVHPELPLDIEENYTICDPSLQSVIRLDGNLSNDRWEWKDSNGTIISTNRIFQLTEPGSFSVTVYKTQGGMICSRTEAFVVKDITAPVFDEVTAGDYEITASIIGDSLYEFSLDNTYYSGQSTSYTFFNIQPGIHTIYVRDINNCEPPIETVVSFIGFPKYFTPNDDGFNDIWKIHGISSEFYLSARVEIFDRYGKLLHTMDLKNNDLGWNGTFKGEVLRSTDYWFTATLIDLENNTTIQSGHFSLIL